MLIKKTKDDYKIEYNIEYAHIYANEHFNQEHEKGVDILKKLIKKLNKLKKSFVLSVLVDEYNVKNYSFSIEEFLEKLEKLGVKPDFVYFESNLVPNYELFLNETSTTIKREYENYIKKHARIPCSLLVAIWHLKRLGMLKITKKELNYLRNKPFKNFIAKKIITILPEKYRKPETKGLEIIASSHYKKYLGNIENIFY